MRRESWKKGRRPTAAGVLLSVILLPGCFQYVPIDLDELGPSQEVRARLTAQQAEEVEALLGRSDARILEGKVVERLSQGFHLDVPVVNELRGIRVETLNQRVLLPFSEVVELERRELNRARTGALAVAGSVVLGAVLWVTVVDPGGEQPSPNGGGPEESRFPPAGIGFRLLVR